MGARAGPRGVPGVRLGGMQEEEHLRVNGQCLEGDHEVCGRSLGFVRSPVDAMDGEIAINRAPLLGEHNAEVYTGLGLSEREISDLHAAGVI